MTKHSDVRPPSTEPPAGPRAPAPKASALEAWEDEGGAAPAPGGGSSAAMSGTEAQVEWAQRIKLQVNAEFDRVAAALRSIADKEKDGRRADTEAAIAILEDKRAEVMTTEQAGYFIHDWQEIGDQVRRMILDDPRYQSIKRNRAAPPSATEQTLREGLTAP